MKKEYRINARVDEDINSKLNALADLFATNKSRIIGIAINNLYIDVEMEVKLNEEIKEKKATNTK